MKKQITVIRKEVSMKMKRVFSGVLALAAIFTVSGAPAVYAGAALNPKMQSLVDSYLAEARKADKGLKSFSAEEGRRLFTSKRVHSAKKDERSCTTCHTQDPSRPGQTVVGKPIEPMAQSVNKERFTDPEKVEKWFKRNCQWVLERECTPKEKGDFITYMTSI